MNFMNQDNIVVIALNRIGDIIIANLLFLLCSIPLVTIGPSLTALYHCMLRIVKGNEDKVTKTFFRALLPEFCAVFDRLACTCYRWCDFVFEHSLSSAEHFRSRKNLLLSVRAGTCTACYYRTLHLSGHCGIFQYLKEPC